MRAIKTLICIACIGLSAFFVYSSSRYVEDVSKQTVKLEGEVNDLKGKLKNLNKIKIQNSEESMKHLKSCAEQGNAVADFQNKYLSLLSRQNVPANDTELEKNAEKLDTYLSDADKNSRTPWFITFNQTTKGVWKFETTHGFDGADFPVLWTFREAGSNDLLAYTTGNFNVEKNVFSGVKVAFTSKGAAKITADGSPSQAVFDKPQNEKKAGEK